jgi:hypothetical protein
VTLSSYSFRRPAQTLAVPHVLEPRVLFAAPAPSPALQVPSTVQVVIDYSLDANHFFDTQQKRDLLQQAADSVSKWFTDQLAAINPSGGDTWDAVLDDPATGQQRTISNPTVGANQVLLYAGGRDMTDALGRGGPGGYQARGTAAWRDKVATRGQSSTSGSPDFASWGGAITFDTNPGSPWHFGQTTDGLAGANDFLSVATHEVTHLFGFGTSEAWNNFVVGTTHTFDGPDSVALYDGSGNVPLSSDDSHWANGTRDEGQETGMDPLITVGTRHLLTPLDYAGLDDIGWSMPPRITSVTAGAPAAGSTPRQFTVTYAHYAAIDSSSVDGADISVLAPDGSTIPAAFVSSTSSGGGTSRTATYSVAPPGGAWDPADSGTYTIVLNGNQVRSTTAEAVAGGTLGNFVADVSDAPVAALQPVAEPAPGSAGSTIAVVYTDLVAVDPATVDATDITVTGPDGSNVPVTAAAVDSAAPGTPRIATYTISAPGGSWGPEDDGAYTVSLNGGAVSDTSGNGSAAAAVGTFEVSLGAVAFDAKSPAVYTDASGDVVKVTMKGPGSGRVRFTAARPADADGIELDGTTAKTSVNVKVGPAGTGVGGVVVNGSLKGLTGAALDLTGDLTAAGSINSLRLRNASGGTVSAASLGKVKLVTLASDVVVGGAIGTIVAGTVSGAHVFAGVRSDLPGDLPESLADFANPTASIRGVSAKAFSNSFVAASTVGKLVLGLGPTGGVAADRLTSAGGRVSLAEKPFKLKNLDAPGSGSVVGGLDVRVL